MARACVGRAKSTGRARSLHRVYGLSSTGSADRLSAAAVPAQGGRVVLVEVVRAYEEVDAVRRALVLVVLVLAVVPADPAAADRGPWGWPLAGAHEVARPFAPPASRYGAGHRGVDLPSAPGAAVRASAAGRVTYAGLLAGRGVVVVSHGSLRTTYEPVTASVRVGATVALGEVVGALAAGHAGCPVAACLHWGLRRGEEYLDPGRLVERGPVRLLPVDGSRGGGGVGGALGAGGGVGGALGAGGGVGGAEGGADAEGAGAGRPRAVPDRTPAAPPPVHEPSWSLRAAETPLGAAAVVALVVGIALLARPRPTPPDPVSGGVATAAAGPAPVEEEVPGPPAALLDLDEARLRRRAV